MKDKVNILGVWVDMVNIPRAAEKIMQFFNEEGLHKVYTPNSERYFGLEWNILMCRNVSEIEI